MVCERFIGSGRLQEGGYLGTHKQDFEAHRKGCDWRHDADHIDMNPIIPAFPGLNVQETLELISMAIAGEVGLPTVLTVNNHAGSNPIIMDMQFIHELQNPVLPQDAATKWYVDQVLSETNNWKGTLAVGNFSGGFDVDINQGSKITNSTIGGTLQVLLPTNSSGVGGAFRVDAGTGSTSGGSVTLNAGAGSNTAGGNVNITAGSSIAGTAGGVTISCGSGLLGTGVRLVSSQASVTVNGSDITLNAGAALNWPHADGTSGQVITTDGAGNLSFGDAGGGEDLEETLIIGNDGGNLDMTNLGNIYMNTNKSIGIGTLSPTANALHIYGGTNPSVILEETSGSGLKIEDTSATTVNITKSSSSNSEIAFSPMTSSGGTGYVSVGRNSSSIGNTGLLVYRGNGTSTLNHRLLNNGATLAETSGNLTLGSATNSPSISWPYFSTSLTNWKDTSIVGGLSNFSAPGAGLYFLNGPGPMGVASTIFHGWGTLNAGQQLHHESLVHSSTKFIVSYVSSSAFSVTLPSSQLYSVDLQRPAELPAGIYYAKIHAVTNSVGSNYNASYSGTATWCWDGVSQFHSLITQIHASGFFGSVTSPSGATPTLIFTPQSLGYSVRWTIEIELTAAYAYGPE